MVSQYPYHGAILMLSLHGYVGERVELGKPDTGGQVVFVLELARRFTELGYRVDVVTRQFEDQPEEDRIDHGLRVWRIPFGGRRFIRKEDMHDYIEPFVSNFLAAVQTEGVQYDIVNSHYWDAGWAGQRVAEELQIPHVHTPHSLGWWKQQEMADRDPAEVAAYRFDERYRKEFLVYRNCDHVIATSPQQLDILHEQYGVPLDHITPIPPGMDESRYVPVAPRALAAIRRDLDFTDTDVYAVGRAAENKGYDLLIRALPDLHRLVPEARLKLAVGTDAEADQARIQQWQSLAEELGVSEHVHWLGYISDERMPDYYRAGSVFALPSRYEPFGMTAVEAMSCGTPAVLTVHGGLHESVDFGMHALYADPHCEQELATMLALPMRYPRLRERLSVEGARFARRQFGWTNIARRTLAVFDQYRGRYISESGDHGVLRPEWIRERNH